MRLSSKFAKVSDRSFAICYFCAFEINKVSKKNLLSFDFYGNSPLIFGCVPTHSFMPRSVIRLFICVGMTLRMSRWTQVRATVIQAITVFVVNVWEISWANLTVHVNKVLAFCLSITNSIKRISTWKIMGTPIPLHQPFVIGYIHNSNLSSCQRNISDRLILRLDNRLASNATFGHDLTSNEIAAVQPHHHYIAEAA